MRQKALALLLDFSYINRPVKITKRRHQQRGQVGVVRDLFWRKEEPWIVLQLPTGTRMAIPLTGTDIPPEQVPVKSTSPVLDPLRAIPLAKACQELKVRHPHPKGRRQPKTSD